MLTRFAPSPTGYLHVGNMRTALVNWMYARCQNGKFLIRIDDTDKERSQIKYVDSIFKDLSWIGIDWDLTFKQSERYLRYEEVLSHLISTGHVYACYETKEELESARRFQLKTGISPVYSRSSLLLTEEKKKLYEQEKRKPYFRFKLSRNKSVDWNDEVKGVMNIFTNSVSDPVVKREDGNYTYMLPSIIDDIDYKITHVVRGEDHLTNTAIQIQMMLALGANIPQFAHLSLLHFDDNKISKRVGGLDIKSIREEGVESIALSSYLAKLGTSDAIEVCNDLQFSMDSFDIKKFNSASTQFSLNEVYKLNAKVLQRMSFDQVKQRLHQVEIDSSEFWYLVRNNIEKFSDVIEWWQICKYDIAFSILDKDFIKIALDTLPENNFDDNTLSEWVKAIRRNIDVKNLFVQLRLVLTGRESGPELGKLITFIGRNSIIARLKKSV
ncbi:MAG: glutamate--tRNA ligase [Wolbachia endosymbiont of Fragariocoptes setiger]|nr:glutamate--tRNA ligase [Wolbachia endosymbiont of Fragariocoptes setiger]